jgi:hypothetical protein
MANKRSKQKKPKMTGKKGGSVMTEEMGSPTPVRKNRKKK